MKRLATQALFLVLCLALAACAKAPFTGRNQFIMVSKSQEAKLGQEAAKEVLEKEKLSTDKALTARVLRVGSRISAATEDPQQWDFYVVDNDKTVNAFALPGGKVFVYTGLLKLATTDAELAAVVGHEAAHVTARHGAERVSQATALGLGQQLATTLYGGSSATVQAFKVAYGIGANVGVLLPFSRIQEYEADRLGMIYMAKAGYDPQGALVFWEKMTSMSEEEGGKKPPEFLSTHPADGKRLDSMRDLLPEARRYMAAPAASEVPEAVPAPSAKPAAPNAI